MTKVEGSTSPVPPFPSTEMRLPRPLPVNVPEPPKGSGLPRSDTLPNAQSNRRLSVLRSAYEPDEDFGPDENSIQPQHIVRARTYDAPVIKKEPREKQGQNLFDSHYANSSQQLRATGASSHAAIYVNNGYSEIRNKFNHHGPISTFHEVFNARLNKLIFPDKFAPEVRLTSHTKELEKLGGPLNGKYTQVGIASKMVKGFTDWGDFLVRQRGGKVKVHAKQHCPALAHVPKENRAAYRALLDAYDKNRDTREVDGHLMSKEDPTLGDMITNAKQNYGDEAVRDLMSNIPNLRKLDKEALELQNQMLELLPPQFKKSLKKALYQAEVFGNADFANHERANVGFVIQKGVLVGATCIDFGVTGMNTFSGRHRNVPDEPQEEIAKKLASVLSAARVDDFNVETRLNKETNLIEVSYEQSMLVEHSLDFTAVSKDHRITDMMPRAASFKALLAEDETPPLEMTEIAEQLAQFSLPRLREFVHGIYAECEQSDDPNVVEMIDKVKAKGHTEDVVVELYRSRFMQIVQRAELPTENPFVLKTTPDGWLPVTE